MDLIKEKQQFGLHGELPERQTTLQTKKSELLDPSTNIDKKLDHPGRCSWCDLESRWWRYT